MIRPYKWPSGWPREKQPLLLGGATGQGGEGSGYSGGPVGLAHPSPERQYRILDQGGSGNDHRWGPASHAWISEVGGAWETGLGGMGGGALGQLSRVVGSQPPPLPACLPGKLSGTASHLLSLGWLFRTGGPHGTPPQKCHLRSWAGFLSSCGCACLLKCVSAGIAGSPSGGFVGIRKKYPPLGRPMRKKHPSGCDHYQKATLSPGY